ncbi:PIN-like domain-containing protein [Roseovarius aestuarii]|uniref:PIN-like domain-containing protein n=1 Tax=Roseovarius aestuarii TaxID=475083 RepID=UPI001592DDAB|nr:PIN-like domain-containing protein [Roseovarius aestuarii]
MEEIWPKLLQKFGIETSAGLVNEMDLALLEEIKAKLNREISIDALPALIDAIDGGNQSDTFQNAAIGIDSSAFLRIANHPKGEDLIDYFGATHSCPLILPGQTIQEFWNNELSAVDTVAKTLAGSFDRFNKDLDRLDSDFSDLRNSLQTALDSFRDDHGTVYSEATVRKTLSLLNALQSKARVPFAPRTSFRPLAEQRQMTKTPPGFRDPGDGDFFVWVDFLLGLKQAQSAGEVFDKAILLTNDSKPDWGRPGSTHPILVAEANAIVGVPFETWTLKKFADKVLEV